MPSRLAHLSVDILHELLDGFDAAVFLVDGGGAVAYENRKALELCAGLDPDEVDAFRDRIIDAAGQVRRQGQARVVTIGEGEARWWCRLWPTPPYVAGMVRSLATPRDLGRVVAERFGVSVPDGRLAVRVARGMSNHAIASALGISVGTVNSRLWRLYRRLDVRNRAELATRIAAVVPSASND